MREDGLKLVNTLNDDDLDIVVGGVGAWQAAKDKILDAEMKGKVEAIEEILRAT
jgi:hypothetical protein